MTANLPPTGSDWSFSVSVGGVPGLAIVTQTVEAGSTFSYTIRDMEINGIDNNEVTSIEMTSDGGSGVTFDPESKTFSRGTALATVASYTIAGTIL